jgi:hypothetical protein
MDERNVYGRFLQDPNTERPSMIRFSYLLSKADQREEAAYAS